MDYLIAVKSGTVQWIAYNGGTGSGWQDTGIAPAPDAWHNVALVRSGTAASVYVDGQLVDTHTLGGATAASPDTFTVGTQYSGGPLDRYFPGRIDQVKVYNAALDAAAIKSDLQTTVWVWAALVEAAMVRPSGAPCGQPCATPSKGLTDISRTPTGPTSKKPGVGAYADLRVRRSCLLANSSAATSESSKPS